MTVKDAAEPLAANESDAVAALWYRAPDRKLSSGWLVYSFDFVLAVLQGCAKSPQAIRRSLGWKLIGGAVLGCMATAQIVLMLLARTPVLSCFFEILARTFTRNSIGFFLRACYWKARLKHLGQDTYLDQGVEIWGPANVAIGSCCHVDTHVRLAAGERGQGQSGSIEIGNHVHVGPGVHIAGRGTVKIGDYVGISANAHLYSATGVIELPKDPGQLISMSHMAPTDRQHVIEGPIVLEEYAFIGIMARIMPGVRVGRGAIIHANTELTRSVPPFANIGGVPRGRQIGWRRPRRPSPHLNPSVDADAAQNGDPTSGGESAPGGHPTPGADPASGGDPAERSDDE